jgi:Cu2+-exporting ATPase
MIQHWFGYSAPRFAVSAYFPAIFGTAVFLYGGWPFLQGAARELQSRLPGMMTLISLAITVAFLYSALVTLGVVAGIDLWWELATLVAIMLLGHWIEMRSITQAQGALRGLAKLLPDTALRLDEAGNATEVLVTELKPGDVLPARAFPPTAS